MIVDTHCHLHFEAFDEDRDAVLRRAKDAGVGKWVNVGTDPETNRAAQALAARHPSMHATAGWHPHHAHEFRPEDLRAFEEFIDQTKPVAIGEIGLDYFKSEAPRETQHRVFSHLLRLAARKKIPVIVHSRNAFADTAALIRAEGKGKLKGVMHCFSYGEAELEVLLGLGFLASFTGNITFKNAADLLRVASAIPLERLMLETDAPYLAPHPHRGKRNEPAHLAAILGDLARARGMEPADLAEATTRNAEAFFGI